ILISSLLFSSVKRYVTRYAISYVTRYVTSMLLTLPISALSLCRAVLPASVVFTEIWEGYGAFFMVIHSPPNRLHRYPESRYARDVVDVGEVRISEYTVPRVLIRCTPNFQQCRDRYVTHNVTRYDLFHVSV